MRHDQGDRGLPGQIERRKEDNVMRILALEASTTSAKAMLYDTESRTYEEKIKAYGKMYDEEVLHDADKVFDCMAKIGRKSIRQP